VPDAGDQSLLAASEAAAGETTPGVGCGAANHEYGSSGAALSQRGDLRVWQKQVGWLCFSGSCAVMTALKGWTPRRLLLPSVLLLSTLLARGVGTGSASELPGIARPSRSCSVANRGRLSGFSELSFKPIPES
jgi:CHASE2 domain-containing sensor protein